MNVATVKTGKRGRPSFRRIRGVICSSGTHWAFLSDDPDLFGNDFIYLYVSLKFPIRSKNRINKALSEGRDIDVVLSFSGGFHYINGKTFYDCRFVSFPTSVGMSRRGNA